MKRKWTDRGAIYIDYSKSEAMVNSTEKREVKTMIANEELLDSITTLGYLRKQSKEFAKQAKILEEELKRDLGDTEIIYDERDNTVMLHRGNRLRICV